MDLPVDKKKLSGDLKDAGALLGSLPKEFSGAVRMSMEAGGAAYEADFLIQNDYVICASLKDQTAKKSIYGDAAFREAAGRLKAAKGNLDVYSLTDGEFRLVVNANECALLEMVKKLDEAFMDTAASKSVNQDGIEDLETQWNNLLCEWKKIEEKEKPYLELLTKQEINAGPEEDAGGIVLADEMLVEEPEADASCVAPEPGSLAPIEEPPQAEARDDAFPDPMKDEDTDISAQSVLESLDEKPEDRLLDEMILRGDETAEEEKKPEPAVRDSPARGKNVPGAIEEQTTLRDEIRRERERLAPAEKKKPQASEGFEDAITEDILKEIEERFNKMPEEPVEFVEDEELEEPEAAAPEEEENGTEEDKTPPKEDEEAAIDNKILADQIRQELREHIRRMRASMQEKVEKTPRSSAPVRSFPAAPPLQARKQEGGFQEASSRAGERTAENRPPQPLFERMPPTLEENDEKVRAACGPPCDKPLEDTSGQAEAAFDMPIEWADKASAEIEKLKKGADVTWGWDKQKKRFVGKGLPPNCPSGMEAVPTQPENAHPPAQALPQEKGPVDSQAAPQPIQNKPEAPPLPAESPPIKPQVIEPPQAQPDKKPVLVPRLKKKMGFLDKLKFAASKEAIWVISAIDGKKSLEEISKETGVPPAQLKPIVDKLIDQGYVGI